MLTAIPSHAFTSWLTCCDECSACRWSRTAMNGFPRLVACLSITSQQGGAASMPRCCLSPTATRCGSCLRGPPPTRRAPPLLGAAIGVARACGPPDPQIRRRTHARGFTARSRPPDGHRHPKPCAAPPCSSLKAPAARRHVARRRTGHGASFALRVRSPSVGR